MKTQCPGPLLKHLRALQTLEHFLCGQSTHSVVGPRTDGPEGPEGVCPTKSEVRQMDPLDTDES